MGVRDNLALNLRLLRARGDGLSQRELAKISGVSRATIANLERGVTDPGTEVIELLAKALDVPPETLIAENRFAPARALKREGP